MLGVVYVDDEEFVIADIPGLIEGSSDGKGLGHKFLKHLERCEILLHLIDSNIDDVVEEYKAIRAELNNYSANLAAKPEIISLNKKDLISQEDLELKIKALSEYSKSEVLSCSGVTHDGIEDLKRKLLLAIRSAAATINI